jgi:hypothetical protein
MVRNSFFIVCALVFGASAPVRAQTTTTECSSYSANNVSCTTSGTVGVSSTNCTSYAPGSATCTTTGAAATTPAGTSTTNCMSYGSNSVSCTTTTMPAPETTAQRAAEWQQLGAGIHGVVDRLHARHRAQRQERLSELWARTAALQRDYEYGATLVTAANARGDTATVRQLSSDQLVMAAQLKVMGDSAVMLSR